jgi:squalene/oxidosqualene cyclase-like protein
MNTPATPTLGGRLDHAIARAVHVLDRSQRADGSWKGDYSGPLFLTPLYLAARHATGTMPEGPTAEPFIRALRHTQGPDGSWGLGVHNPGRLFTTVLNYVSLRMLGVPVDDPGASQARRWLLAHGGATKTASWGRVVLCILGLQSWEGAPPLQPELYLLPTAVPLHPSKLWCHTRAVFLPMSWLYARRVSLPLTPTLRAVRDEIHVDPYEHIDWAASRDTVADVDAVVPRTFALRTLHKLSAQLEPRIARSSLRRRALDRTLQLIGDEDHSTDYLCLGPVSKALHVIVWHAQDPDGPELRRHLKNLDTYLWTDEVGTRMQGYESSQTWDTAWAIQALSTVATPQALDVLRSAYAFIDAEQVHTDPPHRTRQFRERTAGGWGFSTAAQGWTVSDCTAEALTATLRARPHVSAPISNARLDQAVALLLRSQSNDGGWTSYEPRRAARWLRHLNASDVFDHVMFEPSHTECTSSVVHALKGWRVQATASVRLQIDRAVQRAQGFLLGAQRPDGLWHGGWGVCFTYGSLFAITGLRASGLPADHPALQRAADALERMQLSDGGWGEHVEACRTHQITPTEHSQAVMTAWALLALSRAGRRHGMPSQRGRSFLLGAQQPDGTWHDTAVSGVFNRTCSIHYDAYDKIFPLWALADARSELPE